MKNKSINQATRRFIIVVIGVFLTCVGCGSKSEPISSTTPTPKPTQTEAIKPTPSIAEPIAEVKLEGEVYEKTLASLKDFEDYVNEGEVFFPIFQAWALEDYGSYENEIKIASDTNETEVILDKHLKLPESRVISLMADERVQDIEMVTDFLQALQELEIEQETEYVYPGYQESLPYLDVSILLLNEEDQCISIYIESYMDATLQFTIMQEGQKELLATATSEEVKERIRDLYKLKTVTMEEIGGITKLEYISDNKMWVPVSEEDMEIFVSLLDGARQAAIGRDACPMDNQLRATLQDGEEIVIFCASDSCGSIVVEDTCYYPTQDNQLRLYAFPWIKGA